MTPGLALFYGGLVRAKSVLPILMTSFCCMALVSVLWVLYGYSMAFGRDAGAGLVGRIDAAGLAGLAHGVRGSVPTLAFAAFQLMFAVITPALVSGAVADRARLGGWVLFVALWSTVVYFPVAHWVFAPDGWILGRLGVIDFAGGTAVHVNAGAAALALTLLLGRRVDRRRAPMRPHNVPLVLLGAGMLWFGWFGFNAGSALGANGQAALALLNTQVAAAAGALAWIAVERLRDGRASTVGIASGSIAGLVAITPSCAAVSPGGAVVVGLLAGGVCAYAIRLQYRLGFDDSLDVVGVHLVGGAIGSLLIGVLALPALTGGPAGLLAGGGTLLLGKQALGVLAVGGYSFLGSYALGFLVDRTVGFRLAAEQHTAEADVVVPAEAAYAFDGALS
jgi:Amt family ammonium transporter